MDKRTKRTEKIKSRCRSFLRKEIEEAKDNVRLAYVLGVKQKAGEELTKEELEFVKEQEIEKRVLSKLEDIFDKVKINKPVKSLGEGETFALLRFFYLVRLAQQGFFHLVSSVYPALEPRAITYLADKLVAGSLGGFSSMPHSSDRVEAKQAARTIAFNLSNEVDEPVADGFKTTYKDIMDIANRLGGQGFYDQKKNEQDQQQNSSTEAGQTMALPPPTTTASATTFPPIWVVMPYSSMMDNGTFAMPGAIPTLPFPGSLLSPAPYTKHTNGSEKRNRNIKRKNRSKNKADDALEQQADTQLEDGDNVKDKQHIQGEKKAELDDNNNQIQDNNDKKKDDHYADEEIEDDDDDDDDDDRFADADFSDDDSESDEEEDSQEKADTDLKSEEDLKDTGNNIPIATATTAATIPATTTENGPVAPTQWQTFAASCHGDDGSIDSSVSPKSSSRSPRRPERKL